MGWNNCIRKGKNKQNDSRNEKKEDLIVEAFKLDVVGWERRSNNNI